jgi:hypothetical protein
VTRLWAGQPGFDSQQSQRFFLLATMSQTSSRVHPTSYQMSTRVFSLGVKQPECEANNSPLCTAEIKNEWSCTSIPSYVFMVWYLVKHRDNFIFMITLLLHSTNHFTFLFVCFNLMCYMLVLKQVIIIQER